MVANNCQALAENILPEDTFAPTQTLGGLQRVEKDFIPALRTLDFTDHSEAASLFTEMEKVLWDSLSATGRLLIRTRKSLRDQVKASLISMGILCQENDQSVLEIRLA